VGTNVKQRIAITTLVLGRRNNLKRTTSPHESNRILVLATTQEDPVSVNITFKILLPNIPSCSTLCFRLRNAMTRLTTNNHYCSCDNLSQISGVVACITHRGHRAWYQRLTLCSIGKPECTALPGDAVYCFSFTGLACCISLTLMGVLGDHTSTDAVVVADTLILRSITQ
jgi:hypothetical protein